HEHGLATNSEEDIFFEMVRLFFPEILYRFDSSGYDLGLGLPNNLALFDDALSKLEAEIEGPIKDRIDGIRNSMKSAPEIYYFFRGFPVGYSYVFVGRQFDLVYLRHRKTGFVMVYEEVKFLYNMKLVVIFEEVYKR